MMPKRSITPHGLIEVIKQLKSKANQQNDHLINIIPKRALSAGNFTEYSVQSFALECWSQSSFSNLKSH